MHSSTETVLGHLWLQLSSLRIYYCVSEDELFCTWKTPYLRIFIAELWKTAWDACIAALTYMDDGILNMEIQADLLQAEDNQVSLSLPWACLTWWALLMLMPTDMSALCVGNVISHSQSWTGTFDMNVVEPGTSYSAGCVDEGFPDQTISDNMVICTHCRNSNVHDHCVWCKPVIIVVLIWCDLRFVKWHCNVPWEFSISESSVQTWLVVQLQSWKMRNWSAELDGAVAHLI